jgi:hypothetical protein
VVKHTWRKGGVGIPEEGGERVVAYRKYMIFMKQSGMVPGKVWQNTESTGEAYN